MKKTSGKTFGLLKTFVLTALFGVSAAGIYAQEKDDAETWFRGKEVAPVTVGNTPNTAAFGKHVYFAGQPGAEDLEKYAELGVKTIINLRTEPEMDGLDFDESAAVKKAGMDYVHVPIGREDLDKETIERIMTALDSAGQGPVLLHCARSNRVGYIWTVYRAARHGLSIEDAVAEGKQAGMRAGALEERARKYLEEHPADSSRQPTQGGEK